MPRTLALELATSDDSGSSLGPSQGTPGIIFACSCASSSGGIPAGIATGVSLVADQTHHQLDDYHNAAYKCLSSDLLKKHSITTAGLPQCRR